MNIVIFIIAYVCGHEQDYDVHVYLHILQYLCFCWAYDMIS